MSVLITDKGRMASEANLRPCIDCVRQKGLIILTEIRCENMKLRPHGKARPYVRCTNGMCKAHDTSLTIMDKEVEHICSACFIEVMKSGMRSGG